MEKKVITETDLKNILVQYTTGTLGSFGEYVFKAVYRKELPSSAVLRKHDEQSDFIVDEKKVDVKTKCKSIINKNFEVIYKYAGRKIPGVEYATVGFHKDCISLYYEPWFTKINYENLITYYHEWIADRKNKGRNPNISRAAGIDKTRYYDIINDIRAHFISEKLHFLYRSQTWNGKSNPGNFLPQCMVKREVKFNPKNQFRIYLEFKSPEFEPANINRILAYYEPEYERFEILPPEKAHLSNKLWYKVNMNNLPNGVLFKSIDDLKQNLKK